MRIAREGFREIAIASLVLAGAQALILWLVQPSLTGASLTVLPLGLLWLWVVSFFRDPARRRDFQPGELCAAASSVSLTSTTTWGRSVAVMHAPMWTRKLRSPGLIVNARSGVLALVRVAFPTSQAPRPMPS